MSINTIIIDIETLDIDPTAVILSIGAFAFDRFNLDETRKKIKISIDSQEDETPCFHMVCDITNQIMLGKRTVSMGTLNWWRSQPDLVKNSFIFKCKKYHLETVLMELNSKTEYWKKENKDIKFYFRGTDFDPVILKNALDEYNLQTPWKYYQVRDIRTYIDALTGGTKGYIEKNQPCFEMIKHNALHDAMNDAEQMCIAYNINKSFLNQ
ncbi:3'-5' exonuclease (plasmid) [Orbus sturtevantii]|uniref:3'-5' exonuclease n=1 Tax=Orbus sturtevantii TaxID=3074109 RepID=UPI00370D86F0